MDVYYKSTWSDECNQDITRNLRDQFVQENNADLGYDIVRNTYLPSPFKFYNNGCGTNIYDLKTDVSGNSGSMTTTSNNLKEYAKEQRSHVSNSISASAGGGFDIGFASASLKVSASLDYEMNSAFQSSGASEFGSKRFSSFGVHKLSEIDLVNFNRKKYFATFNDEFIDALKDYITSGYAKAIAKEIFDSFGMVVVEYGVVGGYVQISATSKSSDLSYHFSSETEMKRCYETAVSVSGKYKAVSGSFNAEENGCAGAKLKFMEAQREQFSAEVEETNYVGGAIEPVVGTEKDVFSVTPETAKLLTNADMYDDGDGMRLRLITDFLNPKKINPLEIKRHLLTEAQFEEAQQQLQDHALEILEDIGGFLDDCSSCAGVPYLEFLSGTDEFMCDCYKPLYPTKLVSEGTCESNGMLPIYDRDACIEAANSLEYQIEWGPHGGYEDVVDGCSIRSGAHLFLNSQEGTCDPDVKVDHWTYTGCQCTDWMPCFCADPSPQATVVKSPWTYYVNNFDETFSAVAKVNNEDGAFCGMISYHDNYYEDRRFRFKYCAPSDSASKGEEKTKYVVSDYDGVSTVECSNDSVITSIWSEHSDYYEDRKFSYRCHKFNGWQIDTNTCSWTDYVNDWDGTFQFECGDGKVMTGISSYHDDHHEGRRFKFKCCVWEPL